MNRKRNTHVRYARDKPEDCKLCVYWAGKRNGCRRDEGEPCIFAAAEDDRTEDKCDGCPYGKASPCIGWCTADVMAAVLKHGKSSQ